jgi:predicted PurR-regulated permease PerM
MKSETNESVYDITIRMVIILLIVGWCLLLMYPFVSVILWSLILAMALYPLHTGLSKKLGGKPKLASFIIIGAILIIVILPTFLMLAL